MLDKKEEALKVNHIGNPPTNHPQKYLDFMPIVTLLHINEPQK